MIGRVSVSARALWWEGLRCGLINLPGAWRAERLRLSARLCLCPVDLWRYHEFRAVLADYRGEPFILDVGSPKLLALVLARRHGASVLATDIAECIGPEVAVLAKATRRGRLVPQVFDATNMPLADGSIPFVYAVSSIEHIGGDGDTRAVREMARVLKPGGRAVITVPLVPAFREVWSDADPYGRQRVGPQGKRFFCYLYDRPALEQRLIQPSGLRLLNFRIWEETPPGWYESRYLKWTRTPTSPSSIFTKLLDPYWAHRHIRPAGDSGVRGRCVAAITLEKEE